MKQFYERHCKGETQLNNIGIDLQLKREYTKQHEKLKEEIHSLRKLAETNNNSFRNENVHTMTANQELISEINQLRSAARKKATVQGIFNLYSPYNVAQD